MLHFPFTHPHESSWSERTELLGGKGAGLAMMAGELGLPVPPGFTLTTRACQSYLERGWTAELEAALHEGVAGIEASTGRCVGDGRHPLLLSVRSGAPVSMPGMLDSILNLGLNELTQVGLASSGADFSKDCRKRLEDSFRTSVGEPPPEDLWLQLRMAVEAVFRSAQSSRAEAYRRREGLPKDIATAVNIQSMVFGNRDEASATGVIFSRDPATGESRPYGDVLFCAQGEDVVSGRRETEPVGCLETRLPQVWSELLEDVSRLEFHFRDLCEIEFTVERQRLWLLQVRVGKRTPRAGLRIATELAADPDFPLDRREAVERVLLTLADPPRIVSAIEPRTAVPVARGLGASPGVVSGEVVVDVETALRRSDKGHSVILVRPETSPSDVEGMSRARGLLTSRGGLGSHAAVIARGWGIPAVVGVEALTIDDRGFEIDARRFRVGETISIDGSSGAVYEGSIHAREELAPEVARLLEWADELGLEIPTVKESNTPSSAHVADDASDNASDNTSDNAAVEGVSAVLPERTVGEAVSEEAVIRSLSIRGASTLEALGAALNVQPEAVAGPLDRLTANGQVGPGRPLGLGLTSVGFERATRLLAEDRAAVGNPRATRMLDSFQDFDERMKEAVRDWQLRSVAGEVVPNDHSDTAWDEAVFERLGEIRDWVGPWLADLGEDLPRLLVYAKRLGTALAHTRKGDGRFVASPRVDSFHGIWFELHEDLIRLAGRSRAEEVAAGRAG